MPVIGVELDSDQLVLTQGRDFAWNFQNLDPTSTPSNPVYTDFPAGELYFEFQTGGAQSAIQQVEVTGADGGTYTLALDSVATVPMAFNLVTHAPVGTGNPDIQTELQSLSNIGAGNVYVQPAQLFPVWEFDLTLNSGTDEVQDIEFGSVFGVEEPTGGNFKLGYGNAATGVIAFGASPATVTTALEALSGIGAGNVSVSSTSTGGYRVQFVGALADTAMQLIIGYASGIDLTLSDWYYGLTGALFPKITVSRLVAGTPVYSDELINTLENAFNTFFSSFDSILGVDIVLTLTDELNATLKVTAQNSFDENSINTLATDVTSNSIFGLLNNVASLTGVFTTIHVNYYMNRFYQVQFQGDLAQLPVDTLVANTSSLTGVNAGEVAVDVSVLQVGTPPTTAWPFSISGSEATLFVPAAVSDLIYDRCRWQLVFLPSGETSGGTPIARGWVRVQN